MTEELTEQNKKPARLKRHVLTPKERLEVVERLAADELLPLETVARLAKKTKQWVYDNKREMGAIDLGGKQGWRIAVSGWNGFVRKLIRVQNQKN
ncbi:MAG: hypothetical protein LBH01_01000 [Verrucomicrobiales bacterium]|jgi:hypothetical protein|nr:hypothetical protein [Verrucomicrobiales bacterium]